MWFPIFFYTCTTIHTLHLSNFNYKLTNKNNNKKTKPQNITEAMMA